MIKKYYKNIEDHLYIKLLQRNTFINLRLFHFCDELTVSLVTLVPLKESIDREADLFEAQVRHREPKSIQSVYFVDELAPETGMLHSHGIAVHKRGYTFKHLKGAIKKNCNYNLRVSPIAWPRRDLPDILAYIFKKPLRTLDVTGRNLLFHQPYRRIFFRDILPCVLTHTKISRD